MYIKLTKQKHAKTGKVYQTYRLVESYRDSNGRSLKRLLMNLGTGFEVSQEQWALLCMRIDAIWRNQAILFDLNDDLEREAQRIAKILLSTRTESNASPESVSDYQAVDVNSLEHTDIRFTGGEYVGVEAALQLGLPQILEEAGLNKKQMNIALGSIIGRLVHPGSEASTHRYLRDQSALDELLGADFSLLPHKALYQVSDLLMTAKPKIEAALYQKERDLFQLKETIMLYDLTNTYFEGRNLKNSKSQYGRSKEKRSDCPIVTLGILLGVAGFPKKTEILAGNVSEAGTLKEMLAVMGADKSATVIMDAGIATEANVTWLQTEGYGYIVVSRKRKLVMPEGDRVLLKEDQDNQVEAVLVTNELGEMELYCHSGAKAAKAAEFSDKACLRYEEELKKCLAGLSKKRGTKKYATVLEKLGRLKERYSKIAQHYEVSVTQEGKNASDVSWVKKEVISKDPGIYCLRSNRKDLDAKALWETYTTLTELEAAFRSLKTELGLRPIYHQKESRIDGHLFISVLAYHLLHTIRYQLKSKGIHASWDRIREVLSTQCRITSKLKLKDGRVMHIRKTSAPDVNQRRIYESLGLNPQPGKIKKTISK